MENLRILCICAVWSFSCEALLALPPSNQAEPIFSDILFDNEEILKFNISTIASSEETAEWTAWYSNSLSANISSNYKPCNRSEDGSWHINFPLSISLSGDILVLGISKTNSSAQLLMSNLTRINLNDYVKLRMSRNVEANCVGTSCTANFDSDNLINKITYNTSIRCADGYRNHTLSSDNFITLRNLPYFVVCNMSVTSIKSNFRGYWSDAVDVSVLTLETIPRAIPETCDHGGFTVLRINSTSLSVILHFKDLKPNEAKGFIVGYRVHLFRSLKMTRLQTTYNVRGCSRMSYGDKNFRRALTSVVEDGETYLKFENKQDYEAFQRLHKGENVSLVNATSQAKSFGYSRRHVMQNRKPCLDRNSYVDSFYNLTNLESAVRNMAAIDARTAHGYNNSLQLKFLMLPTFLEYRALPEVSEVVAIYLNESVLLSWKVATSDDDDDDDDDVIIFTVFFCPRNFVRDDSGCLRSVNWTQVEPTIPSSSSRPSRVMKQEVKFPPSATPRALRSFIFGVSATSLRSGLSRGISWKSCEYELEADAILPKVNIFNITSNSASITIDKQSCQFRTGYVDSIIISYCVLQQNTDSICSEKSNSIALSRDVSRYELRDLEPRQAYMLSVNRGIVDRSSVAAAAETKPIVFDAEHLKPIENLEESEKLITSESTVATLVFSANNLHFMTLIDVSPSTQMVEVHQGIMAFLAIAGLSILVLLFLGLLVVYRLYRKSVRSFNKWSNVRIEPPHQEDVKTSTDGTMNIDILPVDDYSEVSAVKIEQNILPLLGEGTSRHRPFSSDSDFMKTEGISLLSLATDSFKSFSDADDALGFIDVGGGNRVIALAAFSSARPQLWGKKSPEDGTDGQKKSSPSFVSLMNYKTGDDIPVVSFGSKKSPSDGEHVSHARKRVVRGLGVTAARREQKIGPQTTTKVTKAVRKVEEGSGKTESSKQEDAAFIRVLPLIVGESKLTPPLIAAQCFPILKQIVEGNVKKSEDVAKSLEQNRMFKEEKFDPPRSCPQLTALHSPALGVRATSVSHPSSCSRLSGNDRFEGSPTQFASPASSANRIKPFDRSGNSSTVESLFSTSSLRGMKCGGSSSSPSETPSPVSSSLFILSAPSVSSSSSSFVSAAALNANNNGVKEVFSAIDESPIPSILPPLFKVASSFSSSSSSSSLFGAVCHASVHPTPAMFASASASSTPDSAVIPPSGFTALFSPSSARDDFPSETLTGVSGEHLSATGSVKRDVDGDDYTGCREGSMLPIRINRDLLEKPARPVIMNPNFSEESGLDDED